jgi:hypothetical protein
MEFIVSVSTPFSNETGHRPELHLTSDGLQFTATQGTGTFSRLVEIMGASRYHTALSAAQACAGLFSKWSRMRSKQRSR